MKINNLVYPIMFLSTILAVFVFPYLLLNGTFSTKNLETLFNPGEIWAIRVGSFVSIYGAFIGLRNGIAINGNRMQADAINDFFTSLGTASVSQTINVSGNPGAATCDTSIATGKGFTVIT